MFSASIGPKSSDAFGFKMVEVGEDIAFEFDSEIITSGNFEPTSIFVELAAAIIKKLLKLICTVNSRFKKDLYFFFGEWLLDS